MRIFSGPYFPVFGLNMAKYLPESVRHYHLSLNQNPLFFQKNSEYFIYFNLSVKNVQIRRSLSRFNINFLTAQC